MDTSVEKKERKSRKPENKTRYLVETKGYKETFETEEKAKAQFDILKKRAIKQRQKITIKIFEKAGEKQTLLDELCITTAYFNDEE